VGLVCLTSSLSSSVLLLSAGVLEETGRFAYRAAADLCGASYSYVLCVYRAACPCKSVLSRVLYRCVKYGFLEHNFEFLKGLDGAGP